jgi:hypothetical protein
VRPARLNPAYRYLDAPQPPAILVTKTNKMKPGTTSCCKTLGTDPDPCSLRTSAFDAWNDVNATGGHTSLGGMFTRFAVTPVPEPSTWILLAVGCGMLVVRSLKRKSL